MRAALALGSNLPSRFGDPAANLREALRRLGDHGRLEAVSRFYDTAPVGYLDQPRFLNAAAVLETSMEPLNLLHALLHIEQSLGRLRSADHPPKGPRTLDLDLLLYEDARGQSVVLNTPDLVLPHPELHRRRFVLDPLAEVAPTWQHPLLHISVLALHEQLNNGS